MPGADFCSVTFSQLSTVSNKKPVISVAPTATVQEALDVMAKNNVLTLAVPTRAFPDKFSFLLSTFDIVLHLANHPENDVNTLTVEDCMTLDSERESYRIWERDWRDTIESTLAGFAKGGLHRILVTDVLGGSDKSKIVTQTDVLRHLYANLSLTNNSPVSFDTPLQKLGFTSRKIITMKETETALQGFQKMANSNIRALPVVDSLNRVKGILKEGDLRGWGAKGGSIQGLEGRSVAEFLKTVQKNGNAVPEEDGMLNPVVSVTGDDTLKDVVEIMVKKTVHRVWILDDMMRCVGVASQSDVLGALVGLCPVSLGSH
ncbi:hypothetical protein HDV05_003364 [Chytridiales sp. JEL 0842]|nr:hypothetical protein HDV05_003364 [Chytridiales sp. JEL 0842]